MSHSQASNSPHRKLDPLLSVTQQGEYAEYYILCCEVTESDIFILASNGMM